MPTVQEREPREEPFDEVDQCFRVDRGERVLKAIIFTKREGKQCEPIALIRVGPVLSADEADELADRVMNNPNLIGTHAQVEDWRGRSDYPSIAG
jgi:hypothetical protein